MSEKINILVVSPDSFGVGKYRCIGPHTFLQNHYGNEFHVDIEFTPPVEDDFYKKYQIVFFHSLLYKLGDIEMAYEMTSKRILWCKQNGIKTVVDIDDYWMPDQFHPLHHMIMERRDDKYKIKIMREVDYITTPTEIFADEIKKRLGVSNVVVFPNAVDTNEIQFQPKPEPSKFTRFAWLGGSTHLHDLELMRDCIISAQYNFKDRIQFVLCGFDTRGHVTEINKETGELKKREIKPEETSWYKYEQFFTDDYKILDDEYVNYLKKFTNHPYDDMDKPYRRIWTKSINSYAESYNTFDVALAPLKNTLFNSCKSQLKVIEAGFHKKPIICSDWGPYTLDLINAVEYGGKINPKGNALLVDINKNHKDWFAHIKRLMKNPAMIEDLGNKLYETVKDKYAMSTVTKNRAEWYKSDRKSVV